MSSVAIGLASILSGAGAIAIAPMAMGMHIADRSMMAYSRSMESSADQAALRYLEQSGNTSKGMIESFEFLKKQHYAAFVNPYDQTHPMSNDRLVAVKNSYSHSKFKENTNSSGLSYRFARASGKLRAFTANNPKELLQNLTSKTDEVAIYMKSILNFRTGNINKAVSCINELLKLKPNDPFYNELKGQILFESGQKEAIDFYAKASSLRPGDNLILLGKAIVGITIYKDSPDKIEPFFQEAKLVSEKEPENIIPLYYMAIYYEKTGQKYLSLLNTAVIALKDGDLHRAKILATEAKKGLPKDSPSWYRAGDIILQSEK
jgi:predicted Zn-dependent protease